MTREEADEMTAEIALDHAISEFDEAIAMLKKLRAATLGDDSDHPTWAGVRRARHATDALRLAASFYAARGGEA